MDAEAAETIRVEVVYALPERQVLLAVDVPAGTTLMQAIERSGIRDAFDDMEVDPARLGVFGRKQPPDHVLREGDRVEIYRPLIADPKEVRRARAKQRAEESRDGEPASAG
jgi:putative ubiquitin-RnfH superfamily antitoxin RatB of RatAB toxin-antitoxin module